MKTRKIYVPTELSESIVMENELLLTFRDSTNVANIPLDGWFTTDLVALSKKICVKTITYGANARTLEQISDAIN